MAVFRIYAEKKPEFAVEAQSVLSDIRTSLRLDINGIRILNRYDADRLSEEDFKAAIPAVHWWKMILSILSTRAITGMKTISAIRISCWLA